MDPNSKHEPFAGDDDDDNFVIDGDLSSNIPAEGDYIAKLIDVSNDTSKAGNAMIVWCIQIIKSVGDGDTKYDEWEDKMYTVMQDNAMWKMNEVLLAFALGEVVDKRIVANFKKRDAVGRYCVITIKHEEYRGLPQAKIDSVKAHPEGAGYKPAGPGM